MPTGPAPCTTTFQPGSICTRSRPAARPVPTVSPSRVSCSAGRSVNTGQQYSSGTTMISLNPPSPRLLEYLRPVGHLGHRMRRRGVEELAPVGPSVQALIAHAALRSAGNHHAIADLDALHQRPDCFHHAHAGMIGDRRLRGRRGRQRAADDGVADRRRLRANQHLARLDREQPEFLDRRARAVPDKSLEAPPGLVPVSCAGACPVTTCGTSGKLPTAAAAPLVSILRLEIGICGPPGVLCDSQDTAFPGGWKGRLDQLSFPDRQFADALAGGGEDRVGDRRSHGRHSGLADAGRGARCSGSNGHSLDAGPPVMRATGSR